MKPVKLILASSSPRRRELLELTGLEFTVIHPECEENVCCGSPEELVLELARRKCMAGIDLLKTDATQEKTSLPSESSGHFPNSPELIILGADTIVFYNGMVLGKPRDTQDARRMLRELSGKTHSVYTGVALYSFSSGRFLSFYEKTDVTFYDVTEAELQEYIMTGEPMDKAGAYGIQGKGAFLVRKINGDFYNVVGLPLSHLMQVLKEL